MEEVVRRILRFVGSEAVPTGMVFFASMPVAFPWLVTVLIANVLDWLFVRDAIINRLSGTHQSSSAFVKGLVRSQVVVLSLVAHAQYSNSLTNEMWESGCCGEPPWNRYVDIQEFTVEEEGIRYLFEFGVRAQTIGPFTAAIIMTRGTASIERVEAWWSESSSDRKYKIPLNHGEMRPSKPGATVTYQVFANSGRGQYLSRKKKAYVEISSRERLGFWECLLYEQARPIIEGEGASCIHKTLGVSTEGREIEWPVGMD
jgi:hypothetical protein